MSEPVSIIGLHKAILWEYAKGSLRAMVAAAGNEREQQARPLQHRWEELDRLVEKFISKIEGDGLHE